MPTMTDLVERSGDLKGELLDFALSPRFARAFRQAQKQYFRMPGSDESGIVNCLDWFALQAPLPDGRTVLEHFAAEHPALTEQERAMLLGWRDVVESIFEVKRRDGEALVVVNLVDELTYRVRSNMGPAVFRQTPRGSFIAARLVPVAEEWLLSGMMSLWPATSRTEIYRSKSEFATQHPALVFRYPEKLEQAWELQRQERRHFVDFFGADLVVLPGRELGERLQAHAKYRTFEARDAEGKTAAELSMETYGVAPPPLEFQAPAEIGDVETVGVICDEIDGLNYFVNFGLLEETFANPELAADRNHRQAVLGYLNDASVSPLPFRRLAERDPARASEVFRRVLKQPDFSWERDGEFLLRRYKASYFEQPVLPSVIPIGETLARTQMAASEPARPRPNYRPARRGKRGRSR